MKPERNIDDVVGKELGLSEDLFDAIEEIKARNAKLVAALRITRANNEALKERDAKLVAALEKLPDSCCAQTGCGCLRVSRGYVKAALANQQSTEKP